MKETLNRWVARLGLDRVPRVKKVIVAGFGGSVLLLGFLMIPLPGPAVLVIPAGLAILATEFVWARRWLRRTRELADKARHALRR